MTVVEALVWLSRSLGNPAADLAILAEGNASAKHGDTFWVKASGYELASLDSDGLVSVDLPRAAAFLDEPDLDDTKTREVLACLTLSRTRQLPSVETFMHAYLLTLPGVSFVGHSHPTALLGLLCTGRAREFAGQRLFPDEIVCCGPQSAFVPYTDPGLPLAKAVRDSVVKYADRRGEIPRTIWIENHGLIAVGQSPREVLAAHLMSAKAAQVTLDALASGLDVKPLTPAQIERIHNRPDEHYRQQLLRQLTGA